MSILPDMLVSAGQTVWQALLAIAIPAPFFLLLAVVVKGRAALSDARRAFAESRINLLIHFLDFILLTPLLALVSLALARGFAAAGLVLVRPDVWHGVPVILTGFIAVFAGDFIGYWRHRLEHSHWLWPSHAIHHSDTEMTWLTLLRFHPINRLSSLILDYAFLLMLGLPPYALIVNNLVRHYYGMGIHADLPWTYGRLGKVFVSPAMHRWHHARDSAAYNSNYATVFSIFDRAFGTFRVPGPCDVPLGVSEGMGGGIAGQLAHPFRPSRYRFYRIWRASRRASRSEAASFRRGPIQSAEIAAAKPD
jgi:sterol desaturase/sphingolipid hydroxylase (fatty acid hydroxylase superfamily)